MISKDDLEKHGDSIAPNEIDKLYAKARAREILYRDLLDTDTFKLGYQALVELLWGVVEASINEANSSRAGAKAFRLALSELAEKLSDEGGE